MLWLYMCYLWSKLERLQGCLWSAWLPLQISDIVLWFSTCWIDSHRKTINTPEQGSLEYNALMKPSYCMWLLHSYITERLHVMSHTCTSCGVQPYLCMKLPTPFHVRVKNHTVRDSRNSVFCEYFLTMVCIMNIPRSKSRIATFIYPSLVKDHKIWPEQCWKTRNSFRGRDYLRLYRLI